MYKQYLQKLVEDYPSAYAKMLASKNVKGNSVDRHSILEWISQQTPLLADSKYKLGLKIYWILHSIDKFPVCETCGKPLDNIVSIKSPLNGPYPRFCSRKCQANSKQVRSKTESTLLSSYGARNAFCIKVVKDNLEKDKSNIDAKRQQTKLDRFGDPTYNNAKVATATKILKYGSAFNLEKCKQTWLIRYGVPNPFQQQSDQISESQKHLQEEVKAKRLAALKANGTFNTSKQEADALLALKQAFKDVQTQYKSDKYPFACDFYIPSKDMYIELNCSWTHGPHAYDPACKDDQRLLEEWKKKAQTSQYYKNAIQTWTHRDVLKRKTAVENNIDFHEFWDIDELLDFIQQTTKSIDLFYTADEMQQELDKLQHIDMSCRAEPPHQYRGSKIVEMYQQDVFYAKEKELWKDPETAAKLVQNRMKYLRKDASQLTSNELLHGFKLAGMHYGYSHFNPLWFKWFIAKFNAKSCYDPCGGWGHRLLGGLQLEKYIYNDLSLPTKQNVDRIIEDFKISNATTYCNDAKTFEPAETFDSMFTCPPYFNVEHYPCGDFKDRQDFDELLLAIFKLLQKRDSCKVLGLVLREDLLPSQMLEHVSKTYKMSGEGRKYLNGSANKLKELMYIFEK